jgi:hypothetical protein
MAGGDKTDRAVLYVGPANLFARRPVASRCHLLIGYKWTYRCPQRELQTVFDDETFISCVARYPRPIDALIWLIGGPW